MSIAPSNYRPEIDGLRALAVVAVIVNHFDRNLLPSGYLGVDIFFVISGYVITKSIASLNLPSLGDFLLDFYARRIKRLAPALVLFVLIMSLVTVLLSPVPRVSLITGMTALFGFSNLWLLRLSADYFAESIELNSFVHTWSLGVEEQFYLVYPLAVWWFVNRSNGIRTLSKVIFGVSVASLIGFIALYQSHQPAAYFLMPTRFWELGVGTLAFLLRDSALFDRWSERIPTAVIVASIMLTLFAPQSAAVAATIAVVLLTAALIAGLRPGMLAYDVFSRREVVYVGLISYSLYLWHWGVIWLGRSTIGIHGWAAVIETFLMFLLAAGSYHFVERPLRQAEWSRRRPLSIGYGLSACGAACAFVFVMFGPVGQNFYLGNLLKLPPPSFVQKTWWQNRVTGEYIEKCHLSGSFSIKYIDECLASRDSQRRHVYLIGDSLARNYLLAVRGVFIDADVRYLTMGAGCAFVPPEIAAKSAIVRCADYVDASYRYLTEHVRSGDIVFIGQSLILGRKERQSPLYFDFIKKFASEITEKQALVVLLDSAAPPDIPPEFCVDVPWRIVDATGCSMPRSTVVDIYKTFDAMALDAARQNPDFYYAPLRTGLCSGDRCGQVMTAGTHIWHDPGHITEAASRELAPMLRATLEKQGFFDKLAVPR